MFEAFQQRGVDNKAKRRLAVSTVAATGAYVVAGVAAITLARGATVAQERMLEVTFEKQLPKKEIERPPPPRPPPPAPRVERPKPAPAPPPPAAEPPAPLLPIVPKVAPKESLPESEPAIDKPAFVPPAEGIGGGSRLGVPGGAIGGVPGGVGTGPGTGTVAPPTGPVNLPEEAVPPVESPDNPRPEYPESARAAGKEGLVVLKIVVTDLGRVENIQVLKGESPFVEAAIAAVKHYRYQPAFLAGRAIAVFRIVKVPFRLSVGGG